MPIGENIKTMRRKRGFTQEELASRLGVTPQAISKWENGNGLPDITQLVPLAQIFGVSTDSLLGVMSAAYGEAHTESVRNHIKLLMSSDRSAAEKHLAVYTYLRAESEKEPTNYTIMRYCINHAAEISRYADFDGFMSDSAEMRDEIFADCERRNACISCYCEDKVNIQKSDFAMAWIYIHTKQFDKAKQLIDRLPSIESNQLRESIMTQLVNFQYGFEPEKRVISDNIRKLLYVTAKEFYYDFVDYVWNAIGRESILMANKMLDILSAYKAFEYLLPDILAWEVKIRCYLPKCYTAIEEFEKAGVELNTIAEQFEKLSLSTNFASAEEARHEALAMIKNAVELIDDQYRERVKEAAGFKSAMEIIERMR